jgi:U3 small nucleolar RNA-associated protein 24
LFPFFFFFFSVPPLPQGKAKKTKKFAAVKRMLKPTDNRHGKKLEHGASGSGKGKGGAPKDGPGSDKVRQLEQSNPALFFKYNSAIQPPYRVLIDTNFINHCIKNKIDIVNGMMDCLVAKCIPVLLDCVLAELEKLGTKYRLALRLAKDPRVERYPCGHAGTCVAGRRHIGGGGLICWGLRGLGSVIFLRWFGFGFGLVCCG